jgi:hypothetical protein
MEAKYGTKYCFRQVVSEMKQTRPQHYAFTSWAFCKERRHLCYVVTEAMQMDQQQI